jgi:Leucine-rich repeat (LRR) protein
MNKRVILLVIILVGLVGLSLIAVRLVSQKATQGLASNDTSEESHEKQTDIEIYKDDQKITVISEEDLKKLSEPDSTLTGQLKGHTVIKLSRLLNDQMLQGEKISFVGFEGDSSAVYTFSDVYTDKESLALVSTFTPSWKLTSTNKGSGSGFIIRSVKRITVLTSQAQIAASQDSSGPCGGSKVYIDLEEALKSPSSVCNLSLADENLQTLPKGFSELKSLKVLNLGHNNFNEFPVEILNINSIIELNLSSNQLKTLPDLSSLSNLEILKVGRNQISVLSPSIGKLTKLTLIELDHNLLTSVPSEIGNLSALKDFEFAYNKLTSLPKEVANLKNVDEVDLKDNPIPDSEKEKIKSYFPKAEIEY